MDLVNQLPGQLSKNIFLSDDDDTEGNEVMMLGYQVQVLKLERRFACDLTCIINSIISKLRAFDVHHSRRLNF